MSAALLGQLVAIGELADKKSMEAYFKCTIPELPAYRAVVDDTILIEASMLHMLEAAILAQPERHGPDHHVESWLITKLEQSFEIIDEYDDTFLTTRVKRFEQVLFDKGLLDKCETMLLRHLIVR